MKLTARTVWLCLLSVVFFTGCEVLESQGPKGGFVGTVDVADLHRFSYKHTLVSGMLSMQSSQEMVFKELSRQVLTGEVAARGFDVVETDADFYVVAKWRKEINTSAVEVVRFSLIVGVYEAASNTIFWRSEQPYIFNAMEYSEARVTQALREGIQDFPNRIVE